MYIRHLIIYLILLSGIFSCKSNKETTGNNQPEQSQPTAIIEDEVIVQLIYNKKIEDLITSFKDIDLEVIRPLGADMYLITYNMDKISSNEILRTLNKHELVKISEFNKRVSIRGN